MTRVDVCAADDDAAMSRLQTVLGELGVVADDNWHDSPLGLGLTTFRRGPDVLTVYRDVWGVDMAGPDLLVQDVLAALSSHYRPEF